MRYVPLADGRRTLPAHVIKLSKIANISTAIFQSKALSSNIMQSLMSYVRSFEESYGARFFDLGVMDTLVDTISSHFLEVKAIVTCVRYSTAGKNGQSPQYGLVSGEPRKGRSSGVDTWYHARR